MSEVPSLKAESVWASEMSMFASLATCLGSLTVRPMVQSYAVT